jgi:low affinity Fe/Cu permease
MAGSSGELAHHAKGSFRELATSASFRLGTPGAFYSAVGVVVLWMLMGPFLHFSEVWQLVINTVTSVLTFVMVFLLQATQNRDARAIQLKLDELIRASNARNRFAGIEVASDEELLRLEREFKAFRETSASALERLTEIPPDGPAEHAPR